MRRFKKGTLNLFLSLSLDGIGRTFRSPVAIAISECSSHPVCSLKSWLWAYLLQKIIYGSTAVRAEGFFKRCENHVVKTHVMTFETEVGDDVFANDER
jgi:hypothetical protein